MILHDAILWGLGFARAAHAEAPAVGGVAGDGLHRFQEILREAAKSPGPGSLALAALLVTLLPFTLVLPMSLVCLAVAASLPPVPAAAVILAGVSLNTALAWTLARTVFGERVERWLARKGGWLGAAAVEARQSPLKWTFVARYLPAPFVAAPMVLSTAGVGLGTTVLGSALGMLPWTVIYVLVARAGREDSLAGIGRAAAGLVLAYAAASLLTRRFAKRKPLKPRAAGRPVLKLYTRPGQEASETARRDLAALRDELGFEVDERSEAELAQGPDEGRAPLARFGDGAAFTADIDIAALRKKVPRGPQRRSGRDRAGRSR